MTATQTLELKKVKILCLDDEERIVNSLKSLFRFKYDVFTALTASDALQILSNQNIAVVISDQRMPEMTGVEFLKQAKEISPHTVRLLLTGFSDLDAIVNSVNDSEIYRFITKPWSNSQLSEIVADSMNVSLSIQIEQILHPRSLPVQQVKTIEETTYVLYKSMKGKSFLSIAALLPEAIRVLHANSTEETIALLEKYPIDVMIAALSSTQADYNLLKLLKRELPNLLTIGLVEFADYEQLIDLINEARLYRYIIKPAKPAQLCAFIKSAIAESKNLRKNPVLLQQHKTMQTSTFEIEEPTLLTRIKSIFKRFKRH